MTRWCAWRDWNPRFALVVEIPPTYPILTPGENSVFPEPFSGFESFVLKNMVRLEGFEPPTY